MNNDADFIAGYSAAQNGVNWWENPHPSGSMRAGAWDDGHTRFRRFPASAGLRRDLMAAKEGEGK